MSCSAFSSGSCWADWHQYYKADSSPGWDGNWGSPGWSQSRPSSEWAGEWASSSDSAGSGADWDGNWGSPGWSQSRPSSEWANYVYDGSSWWTTRSWWNPL